MDDAPLLSEIAAARDGSGAIRLLDFDVHERMPNSTRIGVYLTAQLQPKAESSRLVVALDDLVYRQLHKHVGSGEPLLKSLIDVAIHAIGDYLDENGLPPFTPSGQSAARIDGDAALIAFVDAKRRPEPSDAQIFGYISSKVYWGWRYGLACIGFTEGDARRVGIPMNEFLRVSLAGEGKYWKRNGNCLVPTSRLIQDLPSGVVPGISHPTLINVSDRLQAPRYQAASVSFSKAIDFLNGPQPDLKNAIKEATAAVESLALRVTGLETGTLGDCIKEIRKTNRLPASLLKSLEGLWGFASEEPGVRHGKSAAPATVEREARYAVNLAAASIGVLLDLDV